MKQNDLQAMENLQLLSTSARGVNEACAQLVEYLTEEECKEIRQAVNSLLSAVLHVDDSVMAQIIERHPEMKEDWENLINRQKSEHPEFFK